MQVWLQGKCYWGSLRQADQVCKREGGTDLGAHQAARLQGSVHGFEEWLYGTHALGMSSKENLWSHSQHTTGTMVQAPEIKCVRGSPSGIAPLPAQLGQMNPQ